MNKVKFFYFFCYIIVLSSFFSCSYNENKPENIELMVLNDIIDELVNVEYGIVPVKPPSSNKSDSIDYLNKLSDYINRMDTVQKILFVKDSLVAIEITDYNNLYSILTEEHVGFKKIIEKHQSSQLHKTNHFNVTKLNLTGVKLIPLSSSFKDSNNHYSDSTNVLLLGHIIFSRILFDEEFQRGIFNFSFFCYTKSECGYGQFVLVKKSNEGWVICDKISDWII